VYNIEPTKNVTRKGYKMDGFQVLTRSYVIGVVGFDKSAKCVIDLGVIEESNHLGSAIRSIWLQRNASKHKCHGLIISKTVDLSHGVVEVPFEHIVFAGNFDDDLKRVRVALRRLILLLALENGQAD